VSSVPNPCLPVGRGVIRDFWIFSEISVDSMMGLENMDECLSQCIKKYLIPEEGQ
jgi:hypothetical protein